MQVKITISVKRTRRTAERSRAPYGWQAGDRRPTGLSHGESDALADLADAQARLARADALMAGWCPNGQQCTVHPRPTDTYMRSEAERAWSRQHRDRDYAEMCQRTGTEPGQPAPSWY